ncbi:MAG: hypothetical protein HRT44_12635, partial [Bdellovibrionales bacterium]|nr:hypothetical protein [Bdellovibrionales bacterium]
MNLKSLIILILGAVLYIFYTPVYAQSVCSEVFSREATEQRTTLSLRGRRSSPARRVNPSVRPGRSESQVSRDPELLRALITNRRYPSLVRSLGQGRTQSWFLSLSSNGRLYRVAIMRDVSREITDMIADNPTPQVETLYYNRVAELHRLDPLRAEINLPRKGRRELLVPPEILVKLEVKHELAPGELLQALRRVPRNVQYRRNNSQSYVGRDSFIFFVEIGRERPLEIVMLNEGNGYRLITAFVPEVYRPL